jgi:D-glycero-D-manno-heptose 1,7-bisphosphate phosphatase
MMQKRPAVFFDRDGVLNMDHGYTYRQQDFEWVPGAIQTIQYFNDLGYLVFVITNQSGIARGFYTEQDVHDLHAFINRELAKSGNHIDEFYYCPHHPQGKMIQYSFSCDCRKPEPGMLIQALKKWDIDIQRSLMIGDKISDLQAAEAAGIKGYLFDSANLYEFILKRVIGKSK